MMNIINKLYSPTSTRNSSVTSNMTGSSTVDDPEHAPSTPPRSTKPSIAINIKNNPSTSTTQPSSTTTTEEQQSHQDKKVCYLRFAVILVLISPQQPAHLGALSIRVQVVAHLGALLIRSSPAVLQVMHQCLQVVTTSLRAPARSQPPITT